MAYKGKYDYKSQDDSNENKDCNYDGELSTIPSWANVKFSEIELGDRISGGGVGIIYKGWWNREPVALKTLFDARISADLKKDYMDELLVMSRLNHSNIVKFLGACMTPPNLCFIMELCECSLFQLLHVDRVAFTLTQQFQAAIDIASAMEYLHSLSPPIIHRDLKTHNVLRDYNGSYKICDFGLVCNKTVAAGTPAYMAPELLENRNYNKSVDSYAFGILLWELFCGEIPFNRLDVPEIRQRVISGKRPSIPFGMNSRLADLIARCWHQEPDRRPNFTSIVDELLELEKDIPNMKHTEVRLHIDLSLFFLMK
eukprot:gene2169-2310_t